jgi:hypothetical protein
LTGVKRKAEHHATSNLTTLQPAEHIGGTGFHDDPSNRRTTAARIIPSIMTSS